MALRKTNIIKSRRIANITSVVLYFFISAVFIFETTIARMPINYVYAVPLMLLAIIVLSVIIRNTINHYKLAFNVPFALFLYYTLMMLTFDWKTNHYLLIYLALCAISCIYSHFNRSLTFIIVVNIVNAFLIINNPDIYSYNTPLFLTLLNWAISIFASIIMLVLARAATIHLNKALEHQQSFMDLLDSTENYVAMVNDKNEVVYASKTLSVLTNTEDPSLVQGRPLIDLFPGKSLKIYASKMLKEKDNYAEDWEFTLNGLKRYFKAASHGLRGGSSGALISLYDMTHLAERDEIAVMKDSMKIGLFFMDSNYVIQDHYSRYLEEMLSDTKLFGKLFTDIISDSVSTNELNAITDYFNMVLERSYDQDMLDDINPLHELHYVNKETGDRKIFQFEFGTVERAKGEVFILATVYDITIRVELLQRLAEEESRRQEEMEAVFELIQVDPSTFNDFMKDMEFELATIAKIQKNETLTAHESLVKIYQSVHAIKSNAVILGLNIFGKKVHNLESKIKKLREMEGNVPFAEMLNLTLEIEKIIKEKEGFKDTIAKLQTYAGGNKNKEAAAEGGKQNVKVLLDSLSKTTAKAAEDLEKQIKFIATDIDPEAIDNGPRRTMKEILMQLVRNSAVHGIELPDDRKAAGKNETGIVKLSIKISDDKKQILIRFNDDGGGLNYQRIAEKALSKKLIKKEDANNKDMLIKAIFSPGFSTAEVEGVHGGRGIGLNLVRDRIKEINGSVKLRSEEGKGTMFLVTLPVGPDKDK